MMSAWELPTSLCVGGVDWKIRTDFRAILDILRYFSDPEYEPDEQWEICLDILYEDYSDMPERIKEEAAKQAVWFIDMGLGNDERKRPALMDWEKDASVIIPAVNGVIGKEMRLMEYMHWWTFLGAYMEIKEGLFTQIINIRQKMSKRKKLEKWEQEFLKENRNLVEIKSKKAERSEAETEELRKRFGFKGR